jgi:hypothetical protein
VLDERPSAADDSPKPALMTVHRNEGRWIPAM